MKKKIVIIIVSLTVLIIGFTFAWRIWDEGEDIDVAFTIKGTTVTYDGGTDIRGVKLVPSSSRQSAASNGVAIIHRVSVSANHNVYFTLKLNLDTFPVYLQHNSLVYEVYKSSSAGPLGSIVAKGNFGEAVQGDTIKFVSNDLVSTSTAYYHIYIWIDGNIQNPSTMYNQDYLFVLNASASEHKPEELYSGPGISSLIPFSGFDKSKVKRIITVDNVNVPNNAIDSGSSTYPNMSSIKFWYTQNPTDSSMYDLYIGEAGGVVSSSSSGLFIGFSNLEEIDLSNLDTSKSTNMQAMFYELTSLKKIKFGNSFNTTKVTNMSAMFKDCSSLNELDIVNKFYTTNVTSFSGMFYGMSSLTELNLSNFDFRKGCGTSGSCITTGTALIFNNNLEVLNLNNIKTNATNMSSMFAGSNLKTLIFTNIDTSNVTNMKGMFADMRKIENLELDDMFNTSKVTDMSEMFTGMTNLETLKLGSNFNTLLVSNFNKMFKGDAKLKSIYASKDFDLSSLSSDSDMFLECSSIVGGNGTSYDSNNITSSYAVIDRNGVRGYFNGLSN